MLTLPETLDYQAEAARAKVSFARSRRAAYWVQSMLGGAYIGVAVVLMVSATGPLAAVDSPWTRLVQGMVFGVALTLVLVAGAELVTSNMMTLTQGAIRRSIRWTEAAGTMAFCFLGNLAGAVAFAGMVHASGVVAPGTPGGAMLASVIDHKTAESVGQLFWRGVLCNLLVCVAIWSAARLKSEGAKLAVIFWCLLAFITSGFEHVVANMTTFTLGLLSGVPTATLAEAGLNLFVVGLGNLVGGALLVGVAYAVSTGRAAAEAASTLPAVGAAGGPAAGATGELPGGAAAEPVGPFALPLAVVGSTPHTTKAPRSKRPRGPAVTTRPADTRRTGGR